jgi:hypothetical protein
MYLPPDAFPIRRHWFVTFRPVGTLTIKKKDCQAYSHDVSDATLSKDIHVDLKCGPQYADSADTVTERPKVVTPPAKRGQQQPPSSPGAPEPTRNEANDSVDAIERRLERLKALHERGALTDAEYRRIRERILEGL